VTKPAIDTRGLAEGDRAIVERVHRAGQGHVFRWWDELDESQRQALLSQLRGVDFDWLSHMARRCSEMAGARFTGELARPDAILLPSTPDETENARRARRLGEAALRQGKVAALMVAGGQGSRLGLVGPKGACVIGPVTGRTLFQLQAEKVLAVGKRYGKSVPFYIMTSDATHEPTVDFFEKRSYFGMNPDDVFFLRQEMLPAIDEEGKLLLAAKDRIFTSPTGTGGVIDSLYRSGATADMTRRGVEHVFYFQVDNVLVKVCEAEFVGYHCDAGAEMSCKFVRKSHPGEKVGVLGLIDGKLHVIEYIHMTDADKNATNPDGTLKYSYGSIAVHMIDRDFIIRINRSGVKLPVYLAHKKIPHIDEQGRPVTPQKENGYKFETFVFDALPEAVGAVIVETDRAEEFAPVKNPSGEDSVESARRMMVELYASWLDAAGVAVPRDNKGKPLGEIEISPLFALDQEELCAKLSPATSFTSPMVLEP